MTEHNLPVPDDAPWLNLSPEEVEQLRKQKQELTQYGKEKLRQLMDKTMTETIWENTLDGRYKCTVTRNSQYSGQLKILDEELNNVLCDEEVRLSYGATFGPDVDDLRDWEERIISIVDGETK
jgi:hypothetical protein